MLTFLTGPLLSLALVASALCVGALLRRASVDPEWTRKFTHFLTALACLPLPWLLDSGWQLLATALAAGALIQGLRRLGWAGFLDDVERSHLSEHAYIFGVGAVFLVGHSDPRVYVPAILILGVCDALAAIVGQRFGTHRYRVFGKVRSWEGSLALAASAWVILMGTELLSRGSLTLMAVVGSLALAAALAGVEAVSVSGLDNCTIPVVAVIALRLPPVGWVAVVAQGAALVLPLVISGLGHQLIRGSQLLRALAVPLDDLLFGGARVFGANKTLRGLFVVPLVCGAAFLLELAVVRSMPWEPVRDLLGGLPAWSGLVVGLASALGELPNSFLKRRVGVPAGQQATRFRALFFALDHLDSAVSAGLALVWLGAPIAAVGAGLLLGPVLHVVVNRISFALQLRESAW